MHNPCYDVATRTDCPDREVGCAVECPRWAKYVEERDKMYQERRLDNDIKSTLSPAHKLRIKQQSKNIGRGYWKKN